MPTYSYVCTHCNSCFDAVRPMAKRDCTDCPNCDYQAGAVFSPNANISIPARFALSRHWHLPDTPSPDSGTAAGNNQVHAPKKASFKEQFDKNWKASGGA